MSKIIAALLLSVVALSSLAQQTGGQLTETTRDVFNRGGLTFNSTTSFVFLGVKSPKGIKPSYNEAMSLGSKDTKIVKNRQYYVVKGNTVVQIGSSKKKLLDAMADRADDVEAFIKSNDLSLKSRSDITKIFAYYNNL